MLTRIPVFYADQMVADIESFSPSAGKPRAVIESWQSLGVPLNRLVPEPVAVDQLALAHDRTFVEAVLGGLKANGFGTRSPAVAATLPYTSGAMLGAAREALRNGAVAVAPCSGFHHAGYDHVGGFCTFNGLMVTAFVLKQEGLVGRVGILDFDQHWGDGTEDILKRKGADWISHYSAGARWHSPDDAEEFLGMIPTIIEGMRACELILYQAGADPHIDDPLGGWLTTEQLRERDRRVFVACQNIGVPVAWNLAGGYQTPLRKVLDVHDNTMRECVATYLPLKTRAA
jgi:acetoin utilization deacetylase AcuC-like enzyme